MVVVIASFPVRSVPSRLTSPLFVDVGVSVSVDSHDGCEVSEESSSSVCVGESDSDGALGDVDDYVGIEGSAGYAAVSGKIAGGSGCMWGGSGCCDAGCSVGAWCDGW